MAGPATVKVYVPESAPDANLTVSTLVPDTPQLTGTAAVETYAPDPSGSNAKTWPPENSGGRNCGDAFRQHHQRAQSDIAARIGVSASADPERRRVRFRQAAMPGCSYGET